MGLPYDETNFDETFYRWGLPEGGYWELPLLGPGTQRDWTGWALDQLSDPVYYVVPVAGGLGAGRARRARHRQRPLRARHGACSRCCTSSADSYTAQRITYLQNMRARLQGGTDVDELEDVYADY